MADFSNVDYWDERYANRPELFDWYQIYQNLKEFISLLFNKNDNILNIGAGTSKLSEDMYLDGFQNITDIDFSENAVKIMEDRYKEKNVKINYLHMDATDMSQFSRGQFRGIFDKGTLDSILCGENAIPIGDKYIREVYRILADNGTYICISYGDEDHRKSFFLTQDWTIKVEKIPKPNKIISSNINPEDKNNKDFHYVYIMTKKK